MKTKKEDVMSLKYFTFEMCQKFLGEYVKKGFIEKSIDEIIAWIKKSEGDPWFFESKKKEGIETGFDYQNSAETVCGTSWVTYSKKIRGLKVHDEAWDLIWPFGSVQPFFFPPQRRNQTYFKRKLERADLVIEMVNHWPSCPLCGVPLVPVRDDAKVASMEECFHMRWLVCPNESRVVHGDKALRMKVTEIPGISEKSRKLFAAMFDRYLRYQKRFFKKYDRYPVPSRFIRWQRKNGLFVPAAKQGYTDLANEQYCDRYDDLKHEGKSSVYNDGTHLE